MPPILKPPLLAALALLVINGQRAEAQYKKLGVFTIQSQYDGSSPVDSSSYSSYGTAVFSTPYTGKTTQQWEIYSLTNGNYLLANHANEAFMTEQTLSFTTGQPFDMPLSNSIRQQWILTPVGNGYFIIKNAGSGYVLTESTQSNGQVFTQPLTKIKSNYWYIELLHY